MKLQNITGLGMLMSAAIGMLGISSTQAQVVSYESAVDEDGRQASVTFSTLGDDLIVTLDNLGTEPPPVWDATYVLTGVYFSYNGPGSLTAVSATAPNILGTLAGGTTIGSYWAYASGLSDPNGGSDAIVGSGFLNGTPSSGNFGPNGQHLAGSNGGVLGWGNTTGDNPSVQTPLAYTSIQFVLAGLPNGTVLSASDFSNIGFQYGTSTSEPELGGNPIPPSVPEASTVFAGALMLLPLGVGTIRALRKEKALVPVKIS